MKVLPKKAIITVTSPVASRFLKAATSLPKYSNRDFYDKNLQLYVYNSIKNNCQSDFDELIVRMKMQIQSPPYSLLIKGIKFDENYRLFVAICRAFGVLSARPYDKNTPRAQLIHHIEPHTDKNKTETDSLSLQNLAKTPTPTKGEKFSEDLHTDCAERPVPARYVAMQCVRSDPDGQGRSRLLDSIGFRAILKASPLSQDMISTLQKQPVPWQISDYLGGGVTWAPILNGEYIRWRRYTINAALKDENVALPEHMLNIIKHIDALLKQEQHHIIDFLLAPGDFLIMDNHRCLHARSAIDKPNTQRLMLRSWLV